MADEVIAAKAARHLPVVLMPTEARRLLEAASGTMGLIVALLQHWRQTTVYLILFPGRFK